jgi:hypothetical protein
MGVSIQMTTNGLDDLDNNECLGNLKMEIRKTEQG